jgi:hypothetical protein
MQSGTEQQPAGPTAKPFRKTFALAGVVFVFTVIIYLALNPRTMERPGPAITDLSQVFFGMLLVATVVGLWARRSARPWSLLRLGGTTCVAFLVIFFSAWRPKEDPVPGFQQLLFAELREGDAQAAQGTPNILDLLAERFPLTVNSVLQTVAADLLAVDSSAAPNTPRNQFAQAHKAGRKQEEAVIAARIMFEVIEQLDGGKIRNAPIESLRAVIGAHREVLMAMGSGNEASCAKAGSIKSASPAVIRAVRGRVYRTLIAIADGRDRRIERAEPNQNDYVQFLSFSKRRGAAVDDWGLLTSDHASTTDPARLCKALISYYEALLKTEGELGERLLADTAHDLVTDELAAIQSAAR